MGIGAGFKARNSFSFGFFPFWDGSIYPDVFGGGNGEESGFSKDLSILSITEVFR